MNSLDVQMMKMLEDYSGPIVRELAQSRAIAYQNISHSDARIRFAALSLIRTNWGVTQEIADTCEERAISDTDGKVRGAAVLCLSDYYQKTSHPRIVKLLATIVADEKEEFDVRDVAYSGLFFLLEPDPLKWPLGHRFSFPKDIDWVFVDNCLHSPNN
jgi:hypothetical protein